MNSTVISKAIVPLVLLDYPIKLISIYDKHSVKTLNSIVAHALNLSSHKLMLNRNLF